MATFKSQPGINFLGLTPPIFVGDVPVAGNGTAPPATDTQLTCTYSTTSYCADAAAFTAWQNAQLKQLEGWLINDKSTWKIVTGHVYIVSDNGGSAPTYADTPELYPIRDLLAKYGVPLYINGALFVFCLFFVFFSSHFFFLCFSGQATTTRSTWTAAGRRAR